MLFQTVFFQSANSTEQITHIILISIEQLCDFCLDPVLHLHPLPNESHLLLTVLHGEDTGTIFHSGLVVAETGVLLAKGHGASGKDSGDVGRFRKQQRDSEGDR